MARAELDAVRDRAERGPLLGQRPGQLQDAVGGQLGLVGAELVGHQPEHGAGVAADNGRVEELVDRDALAVEVGELAGEVVELGEHGGTQGVHGLGLEASPRGRGGGHGTSLPGPGSPWFVHAHN